MRWPWVSRRKLEEAENVFAEAMTCVNRALALAEDAGNWREALEKQTAETQKLAAILVEIDEKFLKQVGVKLPEGE